MLRSEAVAASNQDRNNELHRIQRGQAPLGLSLLRPRYAEQPAVTLYL